jgi:hypothetical protein
MGDRKRKLDVFTGGVEGQQNGTNLINPFTGRPYSQQYFNILEKRKGKVSLSLLLPDFFQVRQIGTNCKQN